MILFPLVKVLSHLVLIIYIIKYILQNPLIKMNRTLNIKDKENPIEAENPIFDEDNIN